MKTLLATLASSALLVVVASPAFGQGPAGPAPSTAPTAPTAVAKPPPVGQGNFRRDAVVAAARVEPGNARVMGIATASKNLSIKAQAPADAHIMAVSDKTNGSVTLVKAPLDRSVKPTVLTTRDANAMGLVTQKQAEKLAERNGGEVGEPGKASLVRQGIGPGGYSYKFKENVPAGGIHTKSADAYDNPQGVATKVDRTVTVTGKESARIGEMGVNPNIKLTPVVGPTGKTFVRSSETGHLFIEDDGSTREIPRVWKDVSTDLIKRLGLTPADLPHGYLVGPRS